MNHKFQLGLRGIRICSVLLLALALLAGCASHGSSSSRSAHGYYYPAGAGYYPPGHVYYGAYPPGWFFAAPYYPGNYWGYGAMVYWPTYASSYYYRSHYYGGYYRGRHYPYSDPWYYPYSGHYRHVYGHYYGPYNGPYYGYGDVSGGGYRRTTANNPYYGGSHSYRPSSQYGNQGRVVTGSNQPPAQPNRLQPAATFNSRTAPVAAEKPRSANRIPRQPVTTAMPEIRISSDSREVGAPVPSEIVSPAPGMTNPAAATYRTPARSGYQAPARNYQVRGTSQPVTPSVAPAYPQNPDSNHVVPRADRGQHRAIDRDDRRDRD